jgi:APA family basic amino acid/polyamine antiporter
MAVALVMGNMIGSGIFLLPASLARYRGLGIIGWLVSTFGALMLAAVFARLAGIAPAPGGPYVYTRRAFGDLPGFLIAWGYWISIWTSLGALAVALVGYLTVFIPRLSDDPALAAGAALVALWLLVGVNVLGVRSAGWVQAVTTVLKILPLTVMAVAGLLHFDASHFAIEHTGPVAMARTVSAVVTLTLWAFLGLESCTIPAASIDNPQRTIPRATITGTLLTAILYVSSTVGVMSLIDPAVLSDSPAPFADAARTLAGSAAGRAIAAGAAISCFGALNGWILLCGLLYAEVALVVILLRIL